jgi:hypothetical protein
MEDHAKSLRPTVPLCGTRPIVEMMLHRNGKNQCRVRVLLDTGCSTPLISNTLTDKQNIPCLKHEPCIDIRNFSGDTVAGAGERYTEPLLLQHRKHHPQEVFEVAPLEPSVDVFLPFWWIAKHNPQGAWDSAKLRFSTPHCLQNCTHHAATKLSFSLDQSILSHPEARVIGYVAAMPSNPLDLVPKVFRQFLDIMGKEAADALPAHSSYDHEIRLKKGRNHLGDQSIHFPKLN